MPHAKMTRRPKRPASLTGTGSSSQGKDRRSQESARFSVSSDSLQNRDAFRRAASPSSLTAGVSRAARLVYNHATARRDRPDSPVERREPRGLANKIQVLFSCTQTPPSSASTVVLEFDEDNSVLAVRKFLEQATHASSCTTICYDSMAVAFSPASGGSGDAVESHERQAVVLLCLELTREKVDEDIHALVDAGLLVGLFPSPQSFHAALLKYSSLLGDVPSMQLRPGDLRRRETFSNAFVAEPFTGPITPLLFIFYKALADHFQQELSRLLTGCSAASSERHLLPIPSGDLLGGTPGLHRPSQPAL